jgi:hypothetical protein
VAHRQAEAAGQRDPNRFQKPFKANPLPAGIKEPLYTIIAAREQAKKVSYRASRDMTVQRTTERLRAKSQDRCALEQKQSYDASPMIGNSEFGIIEHAV